MAGRSKAVGGWILAGALSCGAASALPSRLSSPAPSQSLEPGTIQQISWSLGVDRDRFDEMELVLSLDGGRTFPLRLTRRIDPRSDGGTWEVPALPAEHARLALRAGSEESAGSETILEVSAEFAIAALPSHALERIFWSADEWRTLAALEGPPPSTVPDPRLRGLPEPEVRGDSGDASAQDKAPRLASLKSHAASRVPVEPGPEVRPERISIPPRPSVRLPMRE